MLVYYVSSLSLSLHVAPDIVALSDGLRVSGVFIPSPTNVIVEATFPVSTSSLLLSLPPVSL